LLFASPLAAGEPKKTPSAAEVLNGLKAFTARTALPDGAFRPGSDKDYPPITCRVIHFPLL